MAAVTFGDLVQSAEQHIDAAGRYRDAVTAASPETARQLQRFALVVARYLDDPLWHYSLVAFNGLSTPPEERALLDMRQALLITAEQLEPLIPQDPEPDLRDPGVRYLAGAVDALAAGRDLLGSHTATGPDATFAERSVWAPVLISQPFLASLASEAGRWAGRVSNWTGWLTSHDHPALAFPRDALSHAETALRRAAVRPGEWDALLRAMPTATPPARIPLPDKAESDTALCEGIAASSDRLRVITFGAADRAAWSSQVSGPAWKRAAWAGALVCHMSEVALTVLSQRGDTLLPETELKGAITALTDARAAWGQSIGSWRLCTTDTPFPATPVTAEADDLVLRLGRLVYAHPRWTPQISSKVRPRDAADLPADAAVLAAVHTASDAIARMAANDRDSIATALAAGRIYMSSHAVSARYAAETRPWVHITAQRADRLLDAYSAAARQGQLAVHALDELVLRIEAPSKVLALARKAVLQQHLSQRTEPAGTVSSHQPGPLETACRKMGATDPGLLLRAHAIDQATHALFIDARRPARLAAKDTPDSTRLPGGTTPARAARRPRPADRSDTAMRRHA
jgi:hypothetical protein